MRLSLEDVLLCIALINYKAILIDEGHDILHGQPDAGGRERQVLHEAQVEAEGYHALEALVSPG